MPNNFRDEISEERKQQPTRGQQELNFKEAKYASGRGT